MSENRLASAASAYLQSAAHQPIHWYPWGGDAFRSAQQHDRPVLLDIGAVWCHWCHVMDGESYEDPALAEYLNANFVCIKVDRDERPDVDARYQRAVQTLIRQGGWPLTAFLTPAGDVFYGGTYFPPDGMHGRPGFRTVLASVLEAYREHPDQIAAQASAIRRVLEDELNESRPGEVSSALTAGAVAQMSRAFDRVHGGFGTQPKFPHSGAITLLLDRWHDDPSDEIRTMIDATLTGMARGGIHDQLAGGFHRYSVDAQWIVPHFEKMSYDNSELLRNYCDAAAAFGTEEYAEAARGIVRWVREVLADPAGGYGASQDADVGLEDDGDYFTWTLAEAAAVLDPSELEVASARFDIGTAGEMHHNPGKNVLYVAATVSAIALRTGRSEADVRAVLGTAIDKLRAARALRTAPFIDRSRYAVWNAMLAGALIRAGSVLDDAWARDHALLSLTRLHDEAGAPDAVPHTPGGIGGLLEDQVQTAAAALDAFELTGDTAWLTWAERILARVWKDYVDEEDGGLFDTARDQTGEGLLPARAKPLQDAPTPSPNGAAAVVALRLAELSGGMEWRERATRLVAAFAGRGAELGYYAATYMIAVDWILQPATHLVIVGREDDPEAGRMHRRALAAFVPRRVVRRIAPDAAGDAAMPPALAAMLEPRRGASSESALGYACIGASCRLPAEGDAAWTATLAGLR